MKRIIIIFIISVFNSFGQIPTDSIIRIPIGLKSSPENGEVELELIARKQHYKQTPDHKADVYDRSISSPKSAIFTLDGSKFYVHSLEGFRTSVYETGSWKRIKVIHHYFDQGTNYLFKGDSISVFNIIKKTKPDEIYNLAAQSHVGVSFEIPEYTTNTDALGTLRILEALLKVNKKTKFYRIINEIPTILMIITVFLIIVKPEIHI